MWDTQAELELWADITQRNLYWFVRVGAGLDHYPKVEGQAYWFCPRIHKPMLDWAQSKVEQWLHTRKRMCIAFLVPRFFGKSTLITRILQLWMHLQDPDLSTYTGSETSERACEFTEAMKKLCDGTDPYAWFTYLFGNWYDKNRDWRKEASVHAARVGTGRSEPSFGRWGVEKGLTGTHPDAGFFDDPSSYDSLASHSNWFQIVNDHVGNLMPVFGDTGLQIWPGTRYGDGDHFGTEFRREGVREVAGMILPDLKTEANPHGSVTLSPKGKWYVYFLDARDSEGTPIFPERCGEEFLQEYERKNSARYWAQMRNDPMSSDFNPFQREQAMQCMVAHKDVPRNLRVGIFFDCAFKMPDRQNRGDSSVIEVWGYSKDGLGDIYFLEGYGSNVWRMEEFLDKFLLVVQNLRKKGLHPRFLCDEKELGGHEGSWQTNIQAKLAQANIPMIPLTTLSRAGKRKYSRIIEAVDFWVEGCVHVDELAPGADQLIEQMCRIGQNMAHDDWVDAAADIVNPKFYRPPNRDGTIQPEEAVKPPSFIGDAILKPFHRMTDKDLTLIYDEGEREHDYYNPI